MEVKADRLAAMLAEKRVTSSFFFQAEDGIRDGTVTGVPTCALPISRARAAVQGQRQRRYLEDLRHPGGERGAHPRREGGEEAEGRICFRGAPAARPPRRGQARRDRSEERRVGKECRSRGSPDHEKEK